MRPDAPVPGDDYPLTRGRRVVDEFHLDIHPVTVERYEAFLGDGGYEEESWWDPKGWAWRRAEGISAPRFWRDDGWGQFHTADRPVVGVSWWEARAFCAWADRRLPSEDEWEAAARGPEGLLFPWGSRWLEGRVGNRGVGPRLTWPVGSWPQSAGPFGHQDLVGNVWQLCADRWEEGSPSRAARGGAWSAPNHQCRTDARNGFKPWGRHSHLGFRTAAP